MESSTVPLVSDMAEHRGEHKLSPSCCASCRAPAGVLALLSGLSPRGRQAAAHDQLRGLPQPLCNCISLPLFGRCPPFSARPGFPGGSNHRPPCRPGSRKGACNIKQADLSVQQLQVSQPASMSSCQLGQHAWVMIQHQACTS